MTLKAPRKPLSAYNFFFQEERANLLGHETIANEHADPKERKKRCHRRTHGKIGFTQLAKHVGQKWKSLDAESKKIYQKKFQQDKVRYAKELEKYEEDLSNMIHLAQVKKALKTLKEQEKEKDADEQSQSMEVSKPDTVESSAVSRRQDCFFNDVLDSAVSLNTSSMMNMNPSFAQFQFGPMTANLPSAVPSAFLPNTPPMVTSMYANALSPQNVQMKLQMLKQEEHLVRMRLQLYEQQHKMAQMNSTARTPLHETCVIPPQVPSQMSSPSDNIEPTPLHEQVQEEVLEDCFEKMLRQLHEVDDPEEAQITDLKENVDKNVEWGSAELVGSIKQHSFDADIELLDFDFDEYLTSEVGTTKQQEQLNLDFLRESIYN